MRTISTYDKVCMAEQIQQGALPRTDTALPRTDTKFRMVKVYLSQALSNELVGMVEVDDSLWRVKSADV